MIVKTLFNKHNGYIRRKQIPDRTTYYQILRMVKSGEVERIKPGVFHCNSNSSNSTMIDIDKIVSGGVLCMYSTWLYYDLSVQIPQCFNFAVEKKSKNCFAGLSTYKIIFLETGIS